MTVLLRGGLLWDGVASQPEPRDVLLDGDHITAVTAPGETRVDDDSLVVDLDGAFVMPGLIDCHVHLVWSGEPDPAKQVAAQGPQTTTVRAVVNAQSQLAAGVTTVRDLGSVDDIAITLARAVDRGHLDGPTIIASGRTVIMTGGHARSGASSPTAPTKSPGRYDSRCSRAPA
jgi:imidazolonepropionase-like amidohydrolase